MSVKPLPFKAQKFGKKLSLILAIVFGLISSGCFAAFLGLTLNVQKDEIFETTSASATTMKDVDDGFIYSTTDCHIVYNDYEGNVVENIDCREVFAKYNQELGTLKYIHSLSYDNDNEDLYVSAGFSLDNKPSTYLFKFIKDENNFVLNEANNYASILNPITSFCVEGDYLYALIRAGGKYCTVNKINKNDLSLPYSTAYLYEKYLNLDDDGVPESVSYERSVNDTIYDLHYVNDYLCVVSNKGVYAINANKFSNYKQLNDEYALTKNYVEDISKAMSYKDYIYFLYSNSGNSPRGLVQFDSECYFLTERLSMGHFSYDELLFDMPEDFSDPVVNEQQISSIEFAESFPENRSAIYYNKQSKLAAVITDLGNTITIVDFSDLKNLKIKFTEEADINITDVIISNDGSKIYYLCQNNEITHDNTSRTIKVKNVDAVNFNLKAGKFTPALLSCSIIFLFLTIIAAFCAGKTLFLEKFILFVKNVKQNWVAYIILCICLTLLAMFCYYPAVGSISMSFFNYKNNEPIVWNNFKNYITIFTDLKMLKSLGNMFIFLVSDIITAIIPPLIFAFFLTVMRNKKMSAVTRTLLFLPSVIPGITKMMIWQTGIYGEYGVINKLIDLFKGNPVTFFDGSNFDIWALILMGFPYVGSYLVFYGALMNIPPSYYEAAELEGLGVWKRFFRIDIPLIKPQIKYVVILTIIASVQNFGRTYMITSSLFTVKTPIHIMYDYINKGNYGLSSAIAALLFVLLLVFTIFNLKKQKEQLGDSI